MAIEGLTIRPPSQLYLPGTPDVAEAVGVTIEAYRALGCTPDEEVATESLTEEFNRIIEAGYTGHLFVRPPQELGFDTLIEAAEGKLPEGVPKIFREPNLWTPGTEAQSYTEEDLNKGPATPLARLALFNADPNTGVDPLLHHLTIPADEEAQQKYGGDTNQVSKLEKDKKAFEAQHLDYDLDQLDHRDFAMLALMDRVRGVEPEDMILSKGFMRVLRLGRRTVVGGSYVGRVISDGGQFGLNGSSGSADSYGGVGVSMGPKNP